MPQSWESSLNRWAEAGLLEQETASRIRAWESSRGGGRGLRWPARLALGLGGLLLAAGVLLFVAAHWDALAPGQRFTIVLATLAVLHLSGALAARRPALSLTLHACGTAALGGGLFLAGQIFHLEEHWAGGLMLWAVGALAGWGLRRDWAQGGLAALLVPAWLAAEWMAATEHHRRAGVVLAVGLLGLALAYLGAERPDRPDRSGVRRALLWIGALGLIPAAIFLVVAAGQRHSWQDALPTARLALGWTTAVVLPAGVAWVLRGAKAWPVAVGVAWAAAAALPGSLEGALPYLWLGGLSMGLVAWGVHEGRPERVNLGVAGFALTLTAFYFSSVMDKLGRSASLIGLGLLFLGGGYLLDRARRRLLSTLREAA